MEEVRQKENDKALHYDKMYFMDVTKINRVMGQLSIVLFLGMSAIGVGVSDVSWWIKILFTAGVLFLGMFVYYDSKYMRGLQKHPFMILPERKVLRYYSEFEGNREISILDMKEVKVYKKGKEDSIWEVMIEGQKEPEDINVSGFHEDTLKELMNDLLSINPYLIFVSRPSASSQKSKT